jgi:N6-adenosine-specific RNA methylase IME4
MTRSRVLVADPPWAFGDRLPGGGRGAAKHYQCMDVEALKSFPLPAMADDSVLLLWRVAAMQREALDVLEAWGFTLKTEIVWRKLTKHGKPHFGMGHYVRAGHETCLLGIRGRWKPRVRNVRSVFEAPVGKHSEKPAAFYDLVEELADGPYVELFARRRRPGWECLGNELRWARPLDDSFLPPPRAGASEMR